MINVLSGTRYSTITNETKSLLKGEYGATPAPVDKDLQLRGIGESAVISCRPADLLDDNYKDVSNEFNKIIEERNFKVEISTENILIYAMFPEIGMTFLENKDNSSFFESEPSDITQISDESYVVTVDDQEYAVNVKANDSIEINGMSKSKSVTPELIENGNSSSNGTVVEAPLGGNIFRILSKEGEKINLDSAVLILEAMKMETEIKAPISGSISRIFVNPGSSVQPGDPLFEINPS